MKIKIKFFVVFLCVAMLVMMYPTQNVTATPTATSKTNATNVIKIGGLGPLSILAGLDMQRGMKLAIDNINANGGVNVAGTNYTLEGDYQTTSGTDGLPDTGVATTSLTSLKSDGVVAMVGGFRTEVVISLQSQLGDYPFLGVGSTAPLITPYFWRVGPTNGSNLATNLISFYSFYMYNLGIKNITVVREDADWSLAISNAIKYYMLSPPLSAYCPGVNFGTDIAISTSDSQDAVTAALTPLKNTNTQAILELFSAPVGQYVTQAWANLNMTQMLAGINVAAQLSTYFTDTAGAAYGEIELETTNPQTTRPQAVAFKDAFEKAYNNLQPTYTAYASYDAVNIIAQALIKSSAPTAAQVQTNLDSTNWNGTDATIKFTNEPGPQYTVNSSGLPAEVSGVDYNTPMTVHDLYTPQNVTASGGIYPNPVMVQWQQNGTKEQVYANLPTYEGQVYAKTVYSNLVYPINHADSGYKTTTKSSPGFEFFAVFIALSTFIVYKKHKKV